MPPMKENFKGECNSGFSIALSADFKIDRNHFHLISPNAKDFGVTSTPIQTNLDFQIFYFMLTINMTSADPIPILLNHEINNTSYLIALNLTCHPILPEELRITKGPIVTNDFNLGITTVIFSLNYNFSIYPIFSPHSNINCDILNIPSASYAWDLLSFGNRNEYYIQLYVNPEYSNAPEKLNVEVYGGSYSIGFEIPNPVTFYNQNPTYTNLIDFPPNDYFYELDFTNQKTGKVVLLDTTQKDALFQSNNTESYWLEYRNFIRVKTKPNQITLLSAVESYNFFYNHFNYYTTNKNSSVFYESYFNLSYPTLSPPNTPTNGFGEIGSYFNLFKVELIPVDGVSYIFRIGINTSVQVTTISGPSYMDCKNLVEGNPKYGIFEGYSQYISTPNDKIFFQTQDFNTYALSYGQLYDGGVIPYHTPINFSEIFTVNDFQVFKFENPTMNLANGETNNTLYYNFTRQFSSPDITLLIAYPDVFFNGFNSKYNPLTKLYYIEFSLPKGFPEGPVSYYLQPQNNRVIPGDLTASLSVLNPNGDLLQPELVSFVAYPGNKTQPTGNTTIIGWVMTIFDEPNGFESGLMEVISEYEFISPRIIQFDETQRISGNSTYGTYLVTFEVDTEFCRNASYGIQKLLLKDMNGLNNNLYNPLLHIIGTPQEKQLTIKMECKAPNVDNTPPTLYEISSSPKVINSYSSNRTIEIIFSIYDLQSGISKIQNPVVILQGNGIWSNQDRIEIQSFKFGGNDTHMKYIASAQLPYGFTSMIGVTMNNVVDRALNSQHYPPIFFTNLGFNITSEANFDYPILDNSSLISKYGGPITLYGKLMGIDPNLSFLEIDYKDGNGFRNISLDFFSSSVLKLKVNEISSTIDFRLTKKGFTSNIFTIIPYELPPVKPTVAPTETPSVTPSVPKQCPGNPICNNKGTCDSSTGQCKCIPQWYGPSCSSQIIIIPTPPAQDNPTSETTYITGSNNITSIIEVIEVRELDNNLNTINKIPIKQWSLNIPKNTPNPIYQYSTKLDQSSTLNITIEFFKNATEIQFGNQNISISESSIKFTMRVSNYTFKSKTNLLQIVMEATIKGKNDDSCSYITIGSDNNENVNWIKMNIDRTSLYGRFIDYGIVDQRIVNIQNVIIDEDDTTNTENTRSTKVGITVPYFEQYVDLDPDFSNLIDVNDDGNNNEICKSSRLSSGAIAGIVVGCIVGVSIIIASALYFRKRLLSKRENKRISQKMNRYQHK